MRRFAVPLAFFAALAVVWHVVANAGIWPPTALPTPGAVLRYLGESLYDGEADWWLPRITGSTMVVALGVTARRLAVGYLIGLAVGLPLGFLTAKWKTCADTIGVLALGLQTLPSVCWVPLALLWFGQTESAMLFVVVMGSLWSIVIATDSGIRTVPPIYVRAARTMGSSGMHTLVRVVFPASLPVVISGMKQGWAFAWRSLMAAEVYVSILTGVGLGGLLDNARNLHAMDRVFGLMLVIVLVGLTVDKALFAPAERFLRRRWGTEADV